MLPSQKHGGERRGRKEGEREGGRLYPTDSGTNQYGCLTTQIAGVSGANRIVNPHLLMWSE